MKSGTQSPRTLPTLTLRKTPLPNAGKAVFVIVSQQKPRQAVRHFFMKYLYF